MLCFTVFSSSLVTLSLLGGSSTTSGAGIGTGLQHKTLLYSFDSIRSDYVGVPFRCNFKKGCGKRVLDKYFEKDFMLQ